MKRILNLNDFSGQALKIILLLGLGLPAVLFLLDRGVSAAGLQLSVLRGLMWFFLIAGAVALLLFFVLVALELIQDEALYRKYLLDRGKQVDEECPFCGNRKLRPFEHTCPVCGKEIIYKT